jgi:hypothetical protein
MTSVSRFIGLIEVRTVTPELLTKTETCDLCQRPYPGHPHGCPNYAHKQGCPPTTSILPDVLNLRQRIMAFVIPFDLEKFANHMKADHPGWTDKQCRNSRYWQASVVKRLRSTSHDYAQRNGLIVVEVPEAHGCNVTATLSTFGIELEWPPVRVVRKVMLIGYPAKRKGTT